LTKWKEDLYNLIKNVNVMKQRSILHEVQREKAFGESLCRNVVEAAVELLCNMHSRWPR